MKILSIQSLGSQRFTVVTDSTPSVATVNLRAFDWNGGCSCRVFRLCCRFVLKHQGQSEKRQRCEHILAVRQWVMENIYPRMIEDAEKIVTLTPTDYEKTALTDSGV